MTKKATKPVSSSIDDRSRNPENWLDEHGDVLFRYALVRVRDRDVAEDLVQSTLLAALVSISGFSGRSSIRTWLISILKHKIIDHFRNGAREKQVGEGESLDNLMERSFDRRGHWSKGPAAWAGDPDAMMERTEFWEAFTSCLKALPPRHAAAFSMREIDGLESEAICKNLGIAATNLWVMLHRARMGLRDCLEKRYFASGETKDD